VPPPRGPGSRIDPLEPTERTENTEKSSTFGESAAAPAATATATAAGEATSPREVEHPGPALWVATVGGVGFGPWAPGTWGALVAVFLFGALLHRLGLPLYSLAVVVVTVLGVWASNAVEAWFGKPDDGRIVIDEVAGQLIALIPVVLLHGLPLGVVRVPGLESVVGAGIDVWWALVVTAFVAFRWFDIRKPGPVAWAEKRFVGGIGVMADDVVAGGLAAVVVTLPAYAVVVVKLRDALEVLPA